MPVFPQILDQRLSEWELAGQKRALSGQRGVDFSSNDYLGFAQDQKLRSLLVEGICNSQVSFGSTGSRLLRGNASIFEEVESELAEFCSQESALIYASGYQANVGVLSALLRETDFVFSDSRNHASIIDGIRLSRPQRFIYSSPDLDDLEEQLKQVESVDALKLIVTESVFGMDGVKASLTKLIGLAERYQADVIVDEAHATGIWGDFKNNRGGGLVQSLGLSSQVLATIHTAGKALGLGGAWVACSHKLKSYLIQSSRSMIFSTAPMPILPLSLRIVMSYWRRVGLDRAGEVIKKSDELSVLLNYPRTGVPVIPYRVGQNHQAMMLAQRVQELGFDVRAIRPPTVPHGTARLRVCVHSNHSSHELIAFSKALRDHSIAMAFS